MSEPKRYTISGLHPHIIESKDGFMVYYEDYARLKAEVERLTEAWVDKKMQEDRDALLQQVERLTKVGDAFSYAMDSLAVFTNEEARLMARTASLAFKDARNAAKEGKQS